MIRIPIVTLFPNQYQIIPQHHPDKEDVEQTGVSLDD